MRDGGTLRGTGTGYGRDRSTFELINPGVGESAGSGRMGHGGIY